MNAHVHIGFVDAVQFAILLIVVGFFFRTVEAKFSETALGKALAYIY